MLLCALALRCWLAWCPSYPASFHVLAPALSFHRSIFAWSRALSHRGRLDGNDALVNFGTALEAATIGTVEGGVMTKDLAICVHGSVAAATEDTYVTTEGFIDAVATKLSDSLAK